MIVKILKDALEQKKEELQTTLNKESLIDGATLYLIIAHVLLLVSQ